MKTTSRDIANNLTKRLRIPFCAAQNLVRAEQTLHRWAELECGQSNKYATRCIERDDTTGKPHLVTYMNTGETYRESIADRESGALKRVMAICNTYGLHFHHQTDPRGCALYVSLEPLTDSTYTRGVAVC